MRQSLPDYVSDATIKNRLYSILSGRWTLSGATKVMLVCVTVALMICERASAVQAPAPAAGQGKLVVYGDVVLFLGRPGRPGNCALQSRFKRGEPVGFRMTAIDPATGEREPSAEFVVHVTYSGKTEDLPMRYRATATQPERQFWVARWVVPETAPTGIIRYTVTAKDKYGRTGEFKPFVVDDSQLTIVE
jgi:hypothetical protein